MHLNRHTELMKMPVQVATPSHANNVARMNAERKNPHAVALGKLTSPAKAKAAEANGKKGGRPVGS